MGLVFLAQPVTALFYSRELGVIASFLPAFVVYMNRFQILPEERALARQFGAEFQAYRSRVRRWL